MPQPEGHVQRIDAITFATANMAESVSFYRALGFVEIFGDSSSAFVTLESESCFVNLWLVSQEEMSSSWWGRVGFHVNDVDEFYKRAITAGLSPAAEPKDAPWGERFFPISDPSGHALSYAKRIRD